MVEPRIPQNRDAGGLGQRGGVKVRECWDSEWARKESQYNKYADGLDMGCEKESKSQGWFQSLLPSQGEEQNFWDGMERVDCAEGIRKFLYNELRVSEAWRVEICSLFVN